RSTAAIAAPFRRHADAAGSFPTPSGRPQKHQKTRQVRDQCTTGAGAPCGASKLTPNSAHAARADRISRTHYATDKRTRTLNFLFAQVAPNLIHSQPSPSIGTRYPRDRPPSRCDGFANGRWQTANDFKKDRAMLDHEGQATGGKSQTLPVEFKFQDHSVR